MQYKAVVHEAWENVIPADIIVTRDRYGKVVSEAKVPEFRCSTPVGKIITFNNKKVRDEFMKGVHGHKVTPLWE